MGIRFYCPNGHKLNVKAFQAGLTGFCPYCGARTVIPTKSTRLSSRRRSKGQGIDTPDESELAVRAGDPPASTSASADMARGENSAEQGKLPEVRNDPLGDSGDKVWYVRPPLGGQYGPAVADVMRVWIAEGRISADTFVWREDWSEWRTAGRVFPHLSATLEAFDAAAAWSEPILAPGSSPFSTSRAPSPKSQAAVIGILALIVLILFILFITILLLRGA